MYSHPNCNRMPGPGDEETWSSYSGHPMDPREPDSDTEAEELQASKRELFEERVQDIDGYLAESFSEASDESLTELAQAIVDDDQAQIGFVVQRMVQSYCWPTYEELDIEENF